MEKPDPAPASTPPLPILHHDEHLVFPGYDLMVGIGSPRQDGEPGKGACTARHHLGEAELPLQGQSRVHLVWYKKHKRKLVVAAIIWFAAFSLIFPLPHPIPPIQSSYPCQILHPFSTILTQHGSIEQPPCPCRPDRLHRRQAFGGTQSRAFLRGYSDLQRLQLPIGDSRLHRLRW